MLIETDRNLRLCFFKQKKHIYSEFRLSGSIGSRIEQVVSFSHDGSC